jgi:hypothetical protein
MRNVVLILGLCVLMAGLAVAADKPGAVEIDGAKRSTGSLPSEQIRATLWVQYDDGTMETDSTTNLYGNKFVSAGAPWGTFYVDQLSFFVAGVTGSNFWLTQYTSINTSGTDLGGPDFLNLGGITATGWWFVDGSTTPVDWIGNTTATFSNTAWISADNGSTDFLGVDTSTTAGHAFTIASFSGGSYTEDSGANAGIRARLNGDQVPVELQAFSIE